MAATGIVDAHAGEHRRLLRRAARAARRAGRAPAGHGRRRLRPGVRGPRRRPGARDGHRAGDAAPGARPRGPRAGSTPGRWLAHLVRRPFTGARWTSSSAAPPAGDRRLAQPRAEPLRALLPGRTGRRGADRLAGADAGAAADRAAAGAGRDPARLRAVRGPAPLPRPARTRQRPGRLPGHRPDQPAAVGRRPRRWPTPSAASWPPPRCGSGWVPEQLSLVEYVDTTLPLASTRRRPLSDSDHRRTPHGHIGDVAFSA